MAPSRASESMCGVARLAFPFTLRSPQPWSSLRMTITLGCSAALEACAERRKAVGTANATIARKCCMEAALVGRLILRSPNLDVVESHGIAADDEAVTSLVHVEIGIAGGYHGALVGARRHAVAVDLE